MLRFFFWRKGEKKKREMMGFEVGVRKKWWMNRAVVMVLWFAASVGILFGLHCYLRQQGMVKAGDALVSMCEERARMIQDQFAVSVNHVHALAILISTFHYRKQPSAIDQDTFAHYTAMTAFERPLLNGIAYAQRVSHHKREMFEMERGWTIKTMKRDASPEKSEYAPVIFSQETVSYLESLDMMSGEEDYENILRARSTGKAVLTNPFRLLGSNHLGVVLTFPVYHVWLPSDATEAERIEGTLGYLGGPFDVESLVDNLLMKLAGSQDIMVNVYDVTNSSKPLIMYGLQQADGYAPLSHISMLDFGDPFRKHLMMCRYSRPPPIPFSAATTPYGVFVICMLLGYIIYAAWSRYDNVKEDYRKMEELKVQAEAADIAKSQFLATVSHEIRTPMNGVLGMLDMLLDTDLNLTQKDFAQTAQVCGKALITLINEVLDRAKIEAGKLEIEAVPFDLRAALDDVLSLFSAKTREKGIELAVFVSDRVPEVLTGDPGRFRQIITNLVGNSVKFTEHGHIFVRVHVVDHSNAAKQVQVKAGLNSRSAEDDVLTIHSEFNTLSGSEAADSRNNWENFGRLLSRDALSSGIPEGAIHRESDSVTLIVSVEDTGIGIPLEAQDRVFTPFMQADSSTSRNYGGTGIGLSISKCLVELMGGQISFVSRRNIGSTFTFTAVLQRCKRSAYDTKIALSESLPTCFVGTKAIIIDRRPVRSAVTRYHLKRLGMNVEVSRKIRTALLGLSGQNGFSRPGAFGREPCQNVIFVEKDSWSTEMDEDLFGQLLLWKRNIKVVLLVTSESDKARPSLVDAVIMKPLRASTLATCLVQILGMGVQHKRPLPNGSAFLHGLLAGKNLLVVDDNKVNLKVAAGVLKKYGAYVECAEGGKEALALLQLPHKYDACFMDVQMPEMDGFEVTRQIRLMESKANAEVANGAARITTAHEWHVPILAMTADVIQATYEECMKCGMDGYVSKPFQEQQLYQEVAKFLVSKPKPES